MDGGETHVIQAVEDSCMVSGGGCQRREGRAYNTVVSKVGLYPEKHFFRTQTGQLDGAHLQSSKDAGALIMASGWVKAELCQGRCGC